MTTPFKVSRLDGHNRSDFDCGVEVLNRYFRQQASQDMRRKVSMCYVVEERSTGKIAGFYTLSAADIPTTDVPIDMTKRLPRYSSIPAGRIGRLATDKAFQGRGLGAVLIHDAVQKMLENQVAFFAVVADAKDEQAEAFYRHLGFKSYGSLPGKMIAPIKKLNS